MEVFKRILLISSCMVDLIHTTEQKYMGDVVNITEHKPIPPQITIHPPALIHYRIDNSFFEIHCNGSGIPHPIFSWKKNGGFLDVTKPQLEILPGSGTLRVVIDDSSNGIYQCFATNELGTAASDIAVVKKAELQEFTENIPVVHQPFVGQNLTLNCNPPRSHPAGTVYWASRDGTTADKLYPIDTSDRISMDYDGNLHFANVEMSDSLGSSCYVCVVENKIIGGLAVGKDHKLQPRHSEGGLEIISPRLMWSSPRYQIGLEGKQVRFKCFFSGFPTPKVTWSREDGMLMNKRMKISKENFGQELVIADLDQSNSGSYGCAAVNSSTNATVKFILVVQAAPRWQKNEPDAILAYSGQNVNISCRTRGIPTPTVAWSINGIPVEESPAGPTTDGDTIYFSNVTNSCIVQCNASNTNGYLFANIPLTVEAPSFNDDIILLGVASFPFWPIPLSIFVTFITLLFFIFLGLMLCHHKIQKEALNKEQMNESGHRDSTSDEFFTHRSNNVTSAATMGGNELNSPNQQHRHKDSFDDAFAQLDRGSFYHFRSIKSLPSTG